jgi:thiol-disulfide isomerase/thioredoxin
MRRCEGKRVALLAATVICVFITSSCSPTALAQTAQSRGKETSDGASRKDDGIDRLIDTMNRLEEKRNAHELQLRSLKDETDRQQRSGEFPPIEEELEELVVLESACRGEHAGCLAVVHLCGLASSYSGTERPVYRALDKVLEHLHEYGHLREVVLGFERLVAHNGMKTLHALTSVIDSKQTSPFVRESARLCRARWQLEMVANREMSESVLESLSVPADITRVKEYLKANFPSVEEAEKWKRAAISELDELAAASTEHHLIVAKAVDPKGFVLTEDSERTNQSPSIAGVAKGLSFRAKHLAVGSECPKLEVKLVNGDHWGLREQNGRLVIVQFSFKGCGPCERMYPVLRDLVRDYPNKVSVLSVMADADVGTTQEAVTTGKMTWSVTWDGQSGPIATEWGVQNFPTVFIFGTDRKLLFSGSIPQEYLAEIVKAFLTQDVK